MQKSANQSGRPGHNPAGDAYFDTFLAGFGTYPLAVDSSQVTRVILSRTVKAGADEMLVSVATSYGLTNTDDGSKLTSGETMDHRLVVRKDAATGSYIVMSDVVTGTSTQPTDAQIAAAKLPTRVRQPVTKIVGKLTTAQRRGQASLRTGKLFESTSVAPSKIGTKATATEARAAASDPYPNLSYSTMANYWAFQTDSDHANTTGEFKYGDAGDNCTNFASQGLNKGGWPIRDTTINNRANLDYWDYDMTGPGTFTYSWSRAEENYRMVHDKAGKSTFGDMTNAFLADLVYFDRNVGGATYGDGVKDHVMETSAITSSGPLFSQKSGNRHNVTPAQVKQNIGSASKYKVYGLHT